tara:strand:+ start:244 stop:432 length:189 start_codon:yes stop_codon:yes gene_type:complete
MAVVSKTFIHNAASADSSSDGLAKDVKTYMDANAPVANGTFSVSSTGIGNNRVFTVVVIQTS